MFTVDPQAIFETIKEGVWKAVKVPFELFVQLPKEAKYAMLGFVIFIGAVILIGLIKSRSEWRYVNH